MFKKTHSKILMTIMVIILFIFVNLAHMNFLGAFLTSTVVLLVTYLFLYNWEQNQDDNKNSDD